MSRDSVQTPEGWRSYNLWSLVIFILLAILAFWGWRTNSASGAGCCAGAPVAANAAAGAVASAAAAGGMSWSNDGKVTLSGVVKDEGTRKKIVDDATAKYGAGNVIDKLSVDKTASSKVVLTGTVPNEAEKKARGDWAQSIYGTWAAIDNQLIVSAPVAAVAVPAPAAAPAAVPVSKPPAVKVYFETGKSDVATKHLDAIGTVTAYLKANATAKAVISGFHDPRGSQAANETLAKERAKSVREKLRTAGIDDARIEMRKPQVTEGSGDLAEARRVELTIE